MKATTVAQIGLLCTVVAVSVTVLAFILDRFLKPRRERRVADALERQALAELSSNKMQRAFKVLIGEDGDPAQGVAEVPGLGKRVARIESQMKPNGGSSLRDVLDQVHAVAVDNQEAFARVEQGQHEAAALAGEAATLAGTADQRIKELGELATERHTDNTQRLDRLERAANEERLRREFYLATLRELYGIELDDPS